MKFISTLSAIAAGLLLCLGATSCDNKNNGTQEFKVQQQITDSFIHISDMSGAQPDMNYKGVSYKVIYDFVAATAEVTIKGLKLPDNTQYPALTIKNIPFKTDKDNLRIVEGTNLTAVSEGFASTPLFDSFKLQVGDRIFNNELYYPLVSIEYTINGSYKAVGSIPSQLFQGTTVTTDADGKSFSNETPVYVLELNIETMKAALTINNAKFVQAMPAQNMTFSGIPFTVSNNGIVSLESTETIVPTINKVPFDSFPITDFKATYNLTTGMNLEFVCTIANQQMADKIKGSPFKVQATLPFIAKKQDQEK